LVGRGVQPTRKSSAPAHGPSAISLQREEGQLTQNFR